MASPANRKRRSTDSGPCVRRLLSSPRRGGGGLHASRLLHQVSNMNSNSSFCQQLLQLQDGHPPQGDSLSAASSSDFHMESARALSDEDFSCALANSWLTLASCIGPLQRVLVPQARHILTSAVRLMNEEIVPLLMHKVQQALAGTASNGEGTSPSPDCINALEEEDTGYGRMEDPSSTSEINTAPNIELMDWEVEQAASMMMMNLNINP